jgi:hypothetical protein
MMGDACLNRGEEMVRKALSLVALFLLLGFAACGGTVPADDDVSVVTDDNPPIDDGSGVDVGDTGVVDVSPDVPAPSCTSNTDCDEAFTDLDSCSVATCNEGNCVVVQLDDGSSCDDNSLCTENDSCLAGSCSGGTTKDCDDDDDCTENLCDAETAECLNPPVEDGTACDDGSVCTADDLCTLGTCAGTLAVVCDDEDPCTEGVCDPESGDCSSKPVTGGGFCDDGDACTVDDFCEEGGCVSGLPRNCQEELIPGVCQSAACEETGCVLNNIDDGLECDDENACTGQGTCDVGACVQGEVVVECNTSIAEYETNDTSVLDAECVVGECVAETGECAYVSINEEGSCSDGTICSETSACTSGGCVQTAAKPIDDNNTCTLDFCTNEGIHPDTEQQILPGIHNWPMDNGAVCVPDNPEGSPCFSGGTCLYDAILNSSTCEAVFDESVPGCSLGDGCYQPHTVTTVPSMISGDTTSHSAQFNGSSCEGFSAFFGTASSDVVVRFVAPEHGLYNFSLANTAAESLDALLYIMDRCPSAEGAVCLASIDEPGVGGEVLSQSMVPGAEVFVVVDGPDNEANVTGIFTLHIEKSDLAEAECADGLDNDADTLMDCADPDCDAAPECHEFACGDEEDNDGDTLIDCADPDCTLSVDCLPDGDSCEKPEIVTSLLPAFLTGDTTGLHDLSQGGDCGDLFGGAPDYVFSFTPEHSGLYRFSLDPEATPFDSVLYLSSGCPPVGAACLAGVDEWFSSGEVIEQVIASGDTVLVFVDGWLENDFGPFTLEIEMLGALEAHCDDGIDDDGDNQIDCQDLDCSGDPACPSEGASCAAPYLVTEPLPFVFSGSTTEMINNFTIPGFSCPVSFAENAYLPHSGAASEDVIFHFAPTESGLYEISLAVGPENADLLIAVFVATCPTGDFAVQCLAGDDTWETGGDSVTLLMYEGQNYYIVLDGWSSLPEVGNVSGPFEFHIDLLGPPTEIDCDDNFDNDGDGFLDCDDPECSEDLACASLDISGHFLVQQNSTKTFTFPEETVVDPGDYILVARGAEKEAFEEYWQVTLGPNVHFFNGSSLFPVINGAETYEFFNGDPALPTTIVLDGPTASMTLNMSMQRSSPPGPANLLASWDTVSATIAATPGSGQVDKLNITAIYISEISDAPGTGTFHFEFVELFYDGPAGE